MKAHILTFGFIACFEEIRNAANIIKTVPNQSNISAKIVLTYIIKSGAPGLGFVTTAIQLGGIKYDNPVESNTL